MKFDIECADIKIVYNLFSVNSTIQRAHLYLMLLKYLATRDKLSSKKQFSLFFLRRRAARSFRFGILSWCAHLLIHEMNNKCLPHQEIDSIKALPLH